MKYAYSSKDLFVESNTYMYSDFIGLEFLEDYLDARADFLKSLEVAGRKADSLEECASHFFSEWVAGSSSLSAQSVWRSHWDPALSQYSGDKGIPEPAPLEDLSNGDDIDTMRTLRALIAAQLHGACDDEIDHWWRTAVQRFEVSKRVYPRYEAGFRNGSGDHQDIRLYALLALISCFRYCATGSFVALNAVLKLMDIVCSLSPQAVAQASPLLLRLLIATELAFVAALAEGKGIRFGR